MKQKHQHSWDVLPKEAITIQQDLRRLVSLEDDYGDLNLVGGVDVGFEADNTITRAAVVVLSFPDLRLVDSSIARRDTSFPYVPGLLSFREVPAVLDALNQLSELPDILLCDGQGLAHPRRLGIACHLGILTDLPTIGVAKSRLTGKYDDVPETKGAWTSLMDGDERIGAVLRTRERVKPLFISTGHRISLESSIDIVMRCVTKYRLPETTRHAHKLASEKKS